MPLGRSIEVRLAAWYSLLLILGLASLGAVLWFGVSYSLTASVDDRLEERVRRLSDYVAAEFGDAEETVHVRGQAAEIKGLVRGFDAAAGLIVIGDTEIRLTPETTFDRGTGVSGFADLSAGQYLCIELSQRDSLWFAGEISLERGFESELREELSEFLMASPDGRWISIRTKDGAPFLPAGQADVEIPWLEGATRSVRTVAADGGVHRVLQDDAAFAGREFRIQASAPLDAVLAAQRRLLHWLAWAAPVGLLLSVGGGYAISRSALRPVEEVVSVAETMDLGRLSERLRVPASGDIVERLARTFNGMLDRLEGSVQRLDEFTADASHELRSPVSVIRTTAELALRHTRSSEELRADMREIQREASRLTDLLEDLLTLARSGSAAPEKKEIDLSAVAVEVAEQHRRMHPSRLIGVKVHGDPVRVSGHELSVRRLLSILLDNAVRHTRDGAEVAVSVEASGENCRLEVLDTGDGIPPEHIDRIFDRFYRVDSARDRAGGGSGLGLAIAKWIAEVHGARIEVQSQVGRGTVFSVKFPRPSRG